MSRILSWKFFLIPVNFIATRFPLKARRLFPICPGARADRIGPTVDTQTLVQTPHLYMLIFYNIKEVLLEKLIFPEDCQP